MGNLVQLAPPVLPENLFLVLTWMTESSIEILKLTTVQCRVDKLKSQKMTEKAPWLDPSGGERESGERIGGGAK